MITSDELIKEYLEINYPDYKYRRYDNSDITKNSFTVYFYDSDNYPNEIDVNVIEFVTFVFNKMNKKLKLWVL